MWRQALVLTAVALLTPGALGVASPAAAEEQAAPTPDECDYPADVVDLGRWKLQLPAGEEEDPDEVKPPELSEFRSRPWFVATADCDAVRFRAPVDGVTTGGSGYPRSELREMEGEDEAEWSVDEGVHTMVIDQSITHLPKGKPHVVAGQIHGGDDDLTTFRLEGSKLYITNGDDAHHELVTSDYELGSRFTAKFVASDGEIKAYVDDVLQTTIESDSSSAYFKVGAYTQANCENASPCTEDNYGEVVLHGLTVRHSS